MKHDLKSKRILVTGAAGFLGSHIVGTAAPKSDAAKLPCPVVKMRI